MMEKVECKFCKENVELHVSDVKIRPGPTLPVASLPLSISWPSVSSNDDARSGDICRTAQLLQQAGHMNKRSRQSQDHSGLCAVMAPCECQST